MTAHHDEEDESDTLKIWVEVHSYKTHAHVSRPHQPLEEFFVEGDYKDEATIIANIAKKTGYSVHEIEDIITFPEGELNAKGDSVDEEATNQDISGIHIMNDGQIMWGNGADVEGATITADNKIKLSDGRVIVPKFDLR
jgi:anaerobic ribonucleoside-triphosphate reductase